MRWRAVADQIRPRAPKLVALLDAAEEDALADMTFPKEHRGSTARSKRRTDVVGILPHEAAIVRLVALLLGTER